MKLEQFPIQEIIYNSIVCVSLYIKWCRKQVEEVLKDLLKDSTNPLFECYQWITLEEIEKIA
jgi:hypothetical protein